MILLVDNYDSFSYNLYQYIGELNPEIKVVRNDECRPEEIRELGPEKLILSPGPGRPEDAGYLIDIIKELAGEIPMLGVCLGHQAICAAFGGVVTYAKRLMHGKQSLAKLDLSCPIFQGLPREIMVARYHSLAAEKEKLPECLKVTAETKEGEIMALQHVSLPIYGLQFHPESILTPEGKRILENYILKI
ncbi:MAG: aminodeoxychorismate/anthranilate synthase component II [Lachnospiraceae bacterium]|nr:aminodeoxychorismate/anthranilate synthase component II [Lachnospiraceae bacterium]